VDKEVKVRAVVAGEDAVGVGVEGAVFFAFCSSSLTRILAPFKGNLDGEVNGEGTDRRVGEGVI
jgi:hypothetical protein